MKIDSENDRKLLLEIIQVSQISGAIVLVVADLIKRIQRAELDDRKDTHNKY